MAERSVTALPEEVPPIKKVYPPPTILFEGLSLERNSPEKIPIIIISAAHKEGVSTAYDSI
nr:MAG TPA: hypothetical protein [Caudoviricetes sp.]